MYTSKRKKSFIDINIKNVVNEKPKRKRKSTRKSKIVLVKPYLLNHQRNPNQVSFLHYHYLAGFGNPNNDLNPRQRPNNLFPDNRNDNVYRDLNRSPESSAPSWDYERNRPPVGEVTPDDSSELEFQNPYYDEVP